MCILQAFLCTGGWGQALQDWPNLIVPVLIILLVKKGICLVVDLKPRSQLNIDTWEGLLRHTGMLSSLCSSADHQTAVPVKIVLPLLVNNF